MTITDAALDAHLKSWATAPAGDDAAAERIISQAVADAAPGRPSRWWAVPGIAAAALAGVLLLKPADQPAPPAPAVAVTAYDQGLESFDALFTPTPDEEAFT